MFAKRYASLFFLILGFAVNTTNAATTNFKPILPIEHWTSNNGIPVYFVSKSQIPMVDVSIIFRAGSAYDGSSPGIAQFTAQMLEQGTTHLNVNQIANRLESVGAHYNTALNQDMTTLHLRSLSEPQFFNPAFNTFKDMVSHANFPPDAIHRLKKQTKTALQQEAQSPIAIAGKAFYQKLYGKHPYASPLLGTNQSIDSITRAKLLAFYYQYYVAKNAVITIVGNITRAKAATLAEQLATALPLGEKATLLTSMPSQATNLYKISYPSQQATILLGQIGITLKDPDYYPLILGNQILGGGILTSKLFTEIRNKRGLCYGISSYFNTLEKRGPFIVSLQTRQKQASLALAETQTTLKNFVITGPKEKELQAAKQALIGSFPLSFANNAAILATLEKIGFYELPLSYLDDYKEMLDKVSIEQVQRAWQKHIKPGKLLTVIVGKN
ncbi:MAG: pitrilysin family protein [Rickettsiella sp.]|nr:pitrilysin family protein [Rickettsiella sp.]